MFDEIDDDLWIFECLLVAGFIITVAVISLCSALCYVCCHHKKEIIRRTTKADNVDQETPATVVVIESDSCHQMEPPTSNPDDNNTAEISRISAVLSRITECNIESAPPPYYVSADQDDLPPPYSVIDKPASIIIEVFCLSLCIDITRLNSFTNFKLFWSLYRSRYLARLAGNIWTSVQ